MHNNPPLERLKKRSEFLAVAKTGDRWVTPAFVIQVCRRALEGSARYGITASRKIGGAVERNRAKRRLRALIRQILPLHACPGTDYVLIAREEILRRTFACMAQELEEGLLRLQRRS
ncbi:MAG: ribonuclease P protein component [Proteobacteria bacterium]|nr:ribonuclease P protein component [Pseudomonadota bacterium]